MAMKDLVFTCEESGYVEWVIRHSTDSASGK